MPQRDRPAEKMTTGQGSPCPDDGKIRYYTRKQAKAEAARIRGKGHGGQGKLRVYQCGEFWHLTSQAAETVAFYRGCDRGGAS